MKRSLRYRYEESLKEARPSLYRWLQANGELSSHLDQVSQRANQEFDSIFAALLEESPEPTSYLERAQHLQTLASQATEMVMESLLVQEGDPIPDANRNDDRETPKG